MYAACAIWNVPRLHGILPKQDSRGRRRTPKELTPPQSMQYARTQHNLETTNAVLGTPTTNCILSHLPVLRQPRTFSSTHLAGTHQPKLGQRREAVPLLAYFGSLSLSSLPISDYRNLCLQASIHTTNQCRSDYKQLVVSSCIRLVHHDDDNPSHCYLFSFERALPTT